jgi:hypothetical protein
MMHRDMCNNIKRLNKPITVGGAGGKMLNIYEEGILDGFGPVYIPENWRVNILCFAEVSDIYMIYLMISIQDSLCICLIKISYSAEKVTFMLQIWETGIGSHMFLMA